MRRRWKAFVVVLSVLVFAPWIAAEKGPIRIGLLTSQTGLGALNGADQMNGLKAFQEKYGDTVAGRKVEFYIEDDQTNVAMGITKVRKLITSDKVHIVMGGLLASTGYAIAPLADQYRVPMFVWTCPDDLSQRQRKKFVVKYFSCSQPQHAMAHWLRTAMPNVKKVVTIGPDYAFGYESTGGFQKVFEDMGGQVIQKIYAPITTVDYGPYLSQIRKDAAGLFITLAGPQSLRMPKQLAEAGLKDKFVIVGNGTNTDEFVLQSLGDEVLGWISAHIYSAAIKTRDNQEFVKTFTKYAHKDPGYYAEGYYSALVMIYKAIDGINGEVEDSEKLLGALRSLKLSDGIPAGPKQADGYGTFNTNVYIRRVEKDASGKKFNKVIHVYENVSQFWTYRPDDFLKQPVYDKDYPPCTYCTN